MDFLKLNWVIIFIVLAFLVIFMSLERKYQFVSEKIGIHPFKLYLIIFVMGIVSSGLNYIALRIFGSWQTLATTIVISALLLLILISFIKRKIRRRKEAKELERLRIAEEERIAAEQAAIEREEQQKVDEFNRLNETASNNDDISQN
ncbi:MAG TPA: hypothetical protein VIG45_06390 [Erysipelothrix sp.]